MIRTPAHDPHRRRIFDPLRSDSPAIGQPCARCGRAFVAGEITTLRSKPDGGRIGLTVEADLVHLECAPYLLDPEPAA